MLRRDIAADGDGLFANLRGIQAFNGSVIAVGVAMQNDSFHVVHLRKYGQVFLKSIIRGLMRMSIEKSSNRLLGEADDALYMICGNRTECEKCGGRGWRNGQAAAHKLARGDVHVRRADAPAFAGCVVFAWVLARGTAFPKPLSREEEARMIERMQAGDGEARASLIEHNLRLAAHIARKYTVPGYDADDLISIGTVGLIKGVNTYKPESGHS